MRRFVGLELAETLPDPEMHQTARASSGTLGMKMHIAIHDTPGFIHSLETTPANTHDLRIVDQLLHDDEERVFGDSGYRGIENHVAPKKLKPKWFVADRSSKSKVPDPDSPKAHA